MAQENKQEKNRRKVSVESQGELFGGEITREKQEKLFFLNRRNISLVILNKKKNKRNISLVWQTKEKTREIRKQEKTRERQKKLISLV